MNKLARFPQHRAIEKEAAEWLIRLDDDRHLSTEESAALREWVSRSPVHRNELRSLARLWGQMNVLTDLAIPLDRRTARGRRRMAGGHSVGIRRHAAIAASVAALALTAGFLVLHATNQSRQFTAAHSTRVGQQSAVSLADGSRIILNTNSKLVVRYTERYRDIELAAGEVHFAVARDAERPFRVFAGDGRVDAVGTEFTVRLDQRGINVTVAEGKVALVPAEQRRDLRGSNAGGAVGEAAIRTPKTLVAGQIGFIPARREAGSAAVTGIETVSLPEINRRLSWRDGVLNFSGESLEEVVDEISRYTEISIEIPDPAVRSIRIGGRFPVGETDKMLAALESNFGLVVIPQGDGTFILNGPPR